MTACETTRVAAGALLRQALLGDPARAGPHLLVRSGAEPERAIALDGELTLGRNRSAGLRLDDPGSSRNHARVRLERSGAATVEDLGSKNGLWLNGHRVDPGPVPLRPGDELLIGRTHLQFVDPLAHAPAGTPEIQADPAPQPRPPRIRSSAWRLLAGSALLLLAAAAALAGS